MGYHDKIDPEATPEGMLQALLRFDRHEADRLYQRLAGLSHQQKIRELIFPLLRELGDRWQAGAITVAHEHLASAWCRDKLTAMLLDLEGGPEDGPVALCAGFPCERHELGLLGLSVLLAQRGYNILYLGSDVPLADLCLASKVHEPALICVSVVMPPASEALASYARQVRQASPAGTRVVIGGVGVAHSQPPPVPGVEWRHDIEEVLGT